MSKGIFVTATGTDVGKTYVSAQMIKKLRKRGLSAGYYKPALSGATLDSDQKLVAADADYVHKVAGISETRPKDAVSFLYPMSASPHLASAMDKHPVTLEKIQQDYRNMNTIFDYITVEGAGGIVCPLRWDERIIMLTDVIRLLDLGVVIVTDSGLGAINASVLTVEYIRRLGIKLKGFIMNGYDNENIIHRDNQDKISRITGVNVIGTVSKNGSLEIDFENLMNLYE